MDVVHMGRKVRFIPNQVLPIAPLPNTAFSPPITGPGLPLDFGNRLRKASFDQAPAQ